MAPEAGEGVGTPATARSGRVAAKGREWLLVAADGVEGRVAAQLVGAAPVPAPEAPAQGPPPAPADNCHPSYHGVCILPPPPDLDCGDVGVRRFQVVPPEPRGFDGDNGGVGCESRRPGTAPRVRHRSRP